MEDGVLVNVGIIEIAKEGVEVNVMDDEGQGVFADV
jgi:hypothetical protein